MKYWLICGNANSPFYFPDIAMTKVYSTRPKGLDDDYYFDPGLHPTQAREVIEPDSEPYPIGILDKYGNEILAQNVLDQIAYVRSGKNEHYH